MAEADDHLAVGDAPADVGLGFIGRGVAALDLERDLVGAAMLGSAQRADAGGDRRIHVGTRAGDHAAGEGRGVELVLGVENQRGVHGADERLAGRLAVQQVQEVAADAVVVGLHLDALAVVRVVEPVEQRRAETGHQPVDDVARARLVLVILLRQHAAECGDGGAHHVHRMRRRAAAPPAPASPTAGRPRSERSFAL